MVYIYLYDLLALKIESALPIGSNGCPSSTPQLKIWKSKIMLQILLSVLKACFQKLEFIYLDS